MAVQAGHPDFGLPGADTGQPPAAQTLAGRAPPRPAGAGAERHQPGRLPAPQGCAGGGWGGVSEETQRDAERSWRAYSQRVCWRGHCAVATPRCNRRQRASSAAAGLTDALSKSVEHLQSAQQSFLLLPMEPGPVEAQQQQLFLLQKLGAMVVAWQGTRFGYRWVSFRVVGCVCRVEDWGMGSLLPGPDPQFKATIFRTAQLPPPPPRRRRAPSP